MKEKDRERQYDQFVGLLARNEQAIRRHVRFLLPTPEGVDDVLQDTALECWKKFDHFELSSEEREVEFVRWASVIARFKVMSWQRNRSRDRLVFRDKLVEKLAESALEQHSTLQHEREAVGDCLDKLPAPQRRLVMSLYTPGESVAKVAEETGANARNLYSQVNAIRQLLLDCVQKRMMQDGRHG